MNNTIFETNIIDREKDKSFKKIKRIVSTIHIILSIAGFLLIYSDFNNNITNWTVKSLMFCLFFIGTVYLIIAVYTKTPFKGKVILKSQSITFLLGKEKTELKLTELQQITFFISEDDYSIGIISNDNNNSLFDLDIIFNKEKNDLLNLINKWQKKGYNVNVISEIKPTMESIRAKTKTQKTPAFSRLNFTTNKIKILPGIPFYATSIIRFNHNTKNELFALVFKCIEYSSWKIIDFYEDGIVGITDPIFITHGDRFTVDFYDDQLTIKSSNAGGGLFTLGSKNITKTFLYNLTILSNEFNKVQLLEIYDEIMVRKASL